LVAHARRLGVPVSVDASSVGGLTAYGVDRFRAWLGAVVPDVLLANEDEAALLQVGGADAPEAVLTVVKQGADPVQLWRAGSRFAEVPVPPVAEVRDTTGAGDAFAAGFLTATMDGADAVTAATAGNAVAGRVLGNPGAAL
jgi:sugar/nucleoside kinase (ribokinase family)